jgi:glycine oxidase
MTHVSPSAPRVAIVGGGAIGLALAWQLAGRGAAVELFERGRLGREASWAAAGMLAVSAESAGAPEAFHDFSLRALDSWPPFARRLQAETGRDIEFERTGVLVAGFGAEADDLRRDAQAQAKRGAPVRWLDPQAARAMEPSLAPEIAGAVYAPEDGHVDNRRLVLALAEAAAGAGAMLHEETEVTAFLEADGRVRGVSTAGGTRHGADAVVLATGAWAGTLGSLLPRAPAVPIRPVKGQMLALAPGSGGAPPVGRVVWGPGIYIVPRRDGRVLLGATVEEAGFDRQLTDEARDTLLDAAVRTVPALAGRAVEEAWCGFRPGTPDRAPILGESGVPGLLLAGGHFRNGILFAPLTADLLTARLLEGAAPPAFHDFGLRRFG